MNKLNKNKLNKKITHLKLCLATATATHNFMWVKITLICLIWDQALANLI